MYEDLHLSKTAEHTRAYIKVQDGCNQFCTYCIIPFARGRVRSRSRDSVLEEVKTLAANGYQEVVLTGIHLTSYGIDCGGRKRDCCSLIRAVHAVDGIRRIRLGSLEPGIITEEFAETIAAAEDVPAFPSVTAERKQWNTEADEPQIYRRRIQTQMRSSA